MPAPKSVPKVAPKQSVLGVLKSITRDLVLFVSGLSLIFFEAVVRDGPERPTLLILYAGMVGLPFIFRGDELRRKMNGNGGEK